MWLTSSLMTLAGASTRTPFSTPWARTPGPWGFARPSAMSGTASPFAQRGVVIFSRAMELILHGRSDIEDALEHLTFKGTAIQMAEFIRERYRDGLNAERFGTEVTIVGFRPAAGRVVAYRQGFNLHGATGLKELAPGIHLAPTENFERAGVRLPPTATRQQAIKLAMMQQAVPKKHNIGICIGGLLQETTVTRDGIGQSIVARYPGYAELRDKFGCPHALADEMEGIAA